MYHVALPRFTVLLDLAIKGTAVLESVLPDFEVIYGSQLDCRRQPFGWNSATWRGFSRCPAAAAASWRRSMARRAARKPSEELSAKKTSRKCGHSEVNMIRKDIWST